MDIHTEQDHEMTDSDKRSLIPDTLSGLSVLPDGTWHGISRPLGGDWGVPGRGTEGHGTDSDTEWDEYGPPQAGDASMDELEGKWDDIVAPLPLYVTVVPDPLKSVTKKSSTRLLIDGTTGYSSAAFSGPDLFNVVQINRDESRVKLTLTVAGNFYTAAANLVLKYGFAVSHDSSFPFMNYVVIDPVVNTTYEYCGTEPLYVAIFPVAAQDATKQNTVVLNATIETASMLDNNPSAKS